MAFAPVQLLVEPTCSAMLFDGSYEDASELVGGINGVLNTPSANRLFIRGEAVGLVEGEGPPEWRIRLLKVNGEEIWAYANWWIVVYSTGLIEFYTDEAYRAKFTLPAAMK